MDLFNKVGEEITNMGNDIVKITKDVSNNAKLQASIVAENNKINEQLRMIGEWFYQKYKDDPYGLEIIDESIGNSIHKIKTSEKKILEAKEAIARNKGGVVCPDCQNTMPKGSSFCNKCGRSM